MQPALLNHVLHRLGLAAHNLRKGTAEFARARVVAPLIGDEALHAGGDGRVDKRVLGTYFGGGGGDDDHVLAGEGLGQFFCGGQVDFADLDAAREGRGRVCAADSRDVEVGRQEGFDQGLANAP